MKTHNTARPYWLPKPRLLLTVVLGVGLTLSVLLFAGARKTWAPEALLASGLILTATLAAYLALNARRTAQLAQVNQQLVAEVAERQRAEQSLRASESRYRLLFESNPHPMWVFDRETLAFLQVNEAAIRHYGYSRSEFLAMTSKDIRPAEDVPALLVDITKATGLRQSGTWRHRKKDGALILVDITIHPLDFDGRPAHLVLANDVTERKAAEAALRQQHETLQAIVENAPLMISCVGPDTRIKWINRAWKDTLKWSLEDTRTQDLFAALYPEPETRREFFDLLDKANGSWADLKMRSRDGTILDTTCTSVRLSDGSNVCIAKDITELKRIEAALRETSQFNQQIIASAQEGIIVFDTSLKHQVWNPYMEQLTGCPAAEVLGKSALEVFPFLHQTDMPAMWASALAGGDPSTVEFSFSIPQTGRSRWISQTNAPFRNACGEVIGIIALIRDITQAKQAEETLRENENRFRLIMETTDEVFWIVDIQNGRTLYVSPGYERIWGRSPAAVYEDQNPFFDTIHPEDRPRVLADYLARQASQTSQSLQHEYRIIRPDGAIRWIWHRGFPIPDQTGMANHYVGVAQDITEKKSLEKQLLRAQRVESIGTLAAGIAHDLNNILTPIVMAADILRLNYPDQQECELLATIQASAQRGAEIVKQVLTFARGVEGQRLVLQPKHLLKEIEKIVHETFPKNICFRADIPKDLWPILGDATQLHQVLLNLCVNARDAMPEGGTLVLGARNSQVDQPKAGLFANGKCGPHVLIHVTDAGHGIPPALIEKIFDPFFTTKEQGKGTGLGLSTVLGIVRSHGGFLDVQSEPGRGATFKIYLPAQPGQTASRPRANLLPPPRGTGECVLVVDDETSIRLAVERVLNQHGYRVLAAGNGKEALEQVSQHSQQLRAVITDIMMPVMDGVALIHALKQSYPGMPVIACTGWGQEGIRAKLQSLGVDSILQKPYPAEVLLTTLHRHLIKRQGASGEE